MSNFSAISSSWFSLVFENGDVRQRLTKSLSRFIELSLDELSQNQRALVEKIPLTRLQGSGQPKIKAFVDSLDESKLHFVAETIAKVYFDEVQE